MLVGERILMKASGKKLPYDAEVEYLQSTGTQYIDTGVVITQTTKMRLDVSIVKNAGNFGCIDTADARCHSDSTANPTVFRVGSVSDAYDFPADTRVNVTVDIQNLVYTIYGISTSMTRPGDLPISTFGLFARNFGGTWTPCSMTVYAVQFYSNGTIVRDFVPVRKGDAGYLYDRVSGRLFGNAGTGAFTIGPDKTANMNGGGGGRGA